MKKLTKKSPTSKALRSLFSASKKRDGARALNISKLIEHYAYAEAIVSSLGDPLVILDSSLQIKSANKAFFKIFKLNKKDAYEKNIFDFSIKKEEIPNLKKLLDNVLIKNIPLQDMELTHIFNKVGEKTLLVSAKRITLEEYKTKLILLSLEDITDRKFRDAQKDDFVGYVTHELKTPLTSISLFLQILTDYHKKKADKKAQYLVDKASSQVERLTHLLNSFVNVYKAQVGMLDLHKEKLDLKKVVAETVSTFQYIQSTHDIQLTGNIKSLVQADRERINEVITNLLTNAIKYSPEADKIIVKLSEDGKNAIVSVQDFGLGIPRDEREKVFERFFRVKGKEELNIKGLGLGLYLVLQIIKAHKGKLWVESTEGKGSTFFFSLPMRTSKLK